MLKTKTRINILHRIIMMWFVLFALTPCTVKEVLFSTLNLELPESLNKSKTTTSSNSCQYSQNKNQHVSFAKQTKINKKIDPIDFSKQKLFVAQSSPIKNNYSKTFSGNSPPKYILFKRLKIDLA